MSAPFENDDTPDALTREYRRATAADDSRPSTATRAAIIAAARAAALESAAANRTATPKIAANDAWWNWKAAASIAVVALAGVLSWRSFRSEPVLPQPTTVLAEQRPVAAPPAPQLAAAPELAPADTAASMQAEPPVLAKKAVANAGAPPSATPAPAAAAAPVLAATERSEARSAGDPAPEIANYARAAPPVAPRAAMRGAVEADSGVDSRITILKDRVLAIMERYFPDAFGAPSTGLRPWILLDLQGRVLRTGKRAWQGTDELQAYLGQIIPGISIANTTVGTVRNGRGQADYALVWMVSADTAP